MKLHNLLIDWLLMALVRACTFYAGGGGGGGGDPAAFAREQEARRERYRNDFGAGIGYGNTAANIPQLEQQLSALAQQLQAAQTPGEEEVMGEWGPVTQRRPIDYAEVARLQAEHDNLASTLNSTRSGQPLAAQRAENRSGMMGGIRDYNSSAFQRELEKAERELKFMLSRQGGRGGSTEADRMADLMRKRDEGTMNIEDMALNAGNEYDRSLEDAYQRGIAQINAGSDASTQITSAMNSMATKLNDLIAGGRGRQWGGFFDDILRSGNANAATAGNAAGARFASDDSWKFNPVSNPTGTTYN